MRGTYCRDAIHCVSTVQTMAEPNTQNYVRLTALGWKIVNDYALRALRR